VVLRVLTALAGPQRAEDCFQETFLAALRAYPRLRPDSNLRAWLLTIARNKTIDAARAAARSAVPVDPLEGLPEHAAPGADPAEVPGLGELAGLDDAGLRAGLHQLSERLRTAVVGRHAADLSYDDLAALLDTTPAAARRAVSDGLAELRRTVPAAPTSAAQHQKEKP
jgi:RNA polymerase sigma factor (sigma-70 family)